MYSKLREVYQSKSELLPKNFEPVWFYKKKNASYTLFELLEVQVSQ